jgi:hypothetical protein
MGGGLALKTAAADPRIGAVIAVCPMTDGLGIKKTEVIMKLHPSIAFIASTGFIGTAAALATTGAFLLPAAASAL